MKKRLTGQIPLRIPVPISGSHIEHPMLTPIDLQTHKTINPTTHAKTIKESQTYNH